MDKTDHRVIDGAPSVAHEDRRGSRLLLVMTCRRKDPTIHEVSWVCCGGGTTSNEYFSVTEDVARVVQPHLQNDTCARGLSF